MEKKIFILILAALLIVPATNFASGDRGEHNKKIGHEMVKMDHGDMKDMDSVGMSTDGKMYLLGTHEVDGVKGMAHMNDVRKQMAEHGMKQTHHIMIAFEDVANGDAVEIGSVAVKIEDPDENISEAIKLVGMDGHYGADVILDKKGMYHFKFGTKLVDGKKRMFHHHFENE
ncbi:MAG: hypothetical protein PF441_07930 [Desulfuromusa sp.]|jgi:hypothetical protein|nr:hypothetical protein [Desulfuromusa sp.]